MAGRSLVKELTGTETQMAITFELVVLTGLVGRINKWLEYYNKKSILTRIRNYWYRCNCCGGTKIHRRGNYTATVSETIIKWKTELIPKGAFGIRSI